MTEPSHPKVIVAALSHDLIRERSIVSLAWPDDPERKLALPVPFGCTLESAHDEADKALRALSDELVTLTVGR